MNYLPEGHSNIKITLIVSKTAEALGFYKKAFNGKYDNYYTISETEQVIHAQISIENTAICLNNASKERRILSRLYFGFSPLICKYSLKILMNYLTKLLEQDVKL